jgi:hypothetical protein
LASHGPDAEIASSARRNFQAILQKIQMFQTVFLASRRGP